MQVQHIQESFYVWELHSPGNSFFFTNRSQNTSETWILLDRIYRCALRDMDRLDFSKVTVNEELQVFHLWNSPSVIFPRDHQSLCELATGPKSPDPFPPQATWILCHKKYIAQRLKYISIAYAIEHLEHLLSWAVSPHSLGTHCANGSNEAGDAFCCWGHPGRGGSR